MQTTAKVCALKSLYIVGIDRAGLAGVGSHRGSEARRVCSKLPVLRFGSYRNLEGASEDAPSWKPAWLPPAFTAPCRKPQTDAPHGATVVPSSFVGVFEWRPW